MENTNQKDVPEELAKINLKVEEVANHLEKGIIGDQWTYLALKNANSYMVASMGTGLKVIENGEVLYSAKHSGTVFSTIYIAHLNCYLLYHHHAKIYRKDIDDQPPYLYMDLWCGAKEGSYFQYSAVNQRLLATCHTEEDVRVSVINLDTKEVEIELEPTDDYVTDIRLLGEKEDRLLFFTHKKPEVILYQLDYAQKTGSLLASVQVETVEGREEYGTSGALCQKSEYVLVELGYNNKEDKNPPLCSSIVVYKIEGDSLVKKASLDVFYSTPGGEKHKIQPCGYAGKHALWVGLSREYNKTCQIYAFDTESNELRELVDKQVDHGQKNPQSLEVFGDQLYFTGESGKVNRLIVEL